MKPQQNPSFKTKAKQFKNSLFFRQNSFRSQVLNEIPFLTFTIDTFTQKYLSVFNLKYKLYNDASLKTMLRKTSYLFATSRKFFKRLVTSQTETSLTGRFVTVAGLSSRMKTRQAYVV